MGPDQFCSLLPSCRLDLHVRVHHTHHIHHNHHSSHPSNMRPNLTPVGEAMCVTFSSVHEHNVCFITFMHPCCTDRRLEATCGYAQVKHWTLTIIVHAGARDAWEPRPPPALALPQAHHVA